MNTEQGPACSESGPGSNPEMIQLIINAIPVPIFVKDSMGCYVYCNTPFENYVGKKVHEIVGRSVFDLWDHDLAKVYQEADNRLFRSGGEQQYEARVRYADGSMRDVIFHKAVFAAMDARYMAGAILDISARKCAERELEMIALTDTLTGVASRYHLYAALEEACKKAARQNCSVALMSIDLDGFKEVNDTYGHLGGDEALVNVANRIKKCIRESDILARLGGDEFVIVFEGLEHRGSIFKLAESILQCVAGEMQLQGNSICLGASIGIAFYPDHGKTPQELLRYADLALYESKQAGKGQYSSIAASDCIDTQ